MPYKKTALPIAAGIMTILAACICFVIGGISLGAYVFFSIQSSHILLTYDIKVVLVTGTFGILGFGSGLASGIWLLRRRHFMMSMSGLFSVLFSGIAIVLGLAIVGGDSTGLQNGLIYGMPIILLAILSLAVIGTSKQEFS